MRQGMIALGALAGALAAAPATAGIKQDFEQCDGRVHPARADDGMRGEASSGPFANVFARAARPEETIISACDRALASDRLLPTQTLRKAHLLRARAAAKLRKGDTDAALADLNLAETAVGDRAGDRFYRRSMAVSLNLLRALAFTQSGKDAEARTLALSAMAVRPYSSQVQRVGAEIVSAVAPAGTDGDNWAQAMRLDPNVITTAVMRAFESGDFARVVALRPQVLSAGRKRRLLSIS